MTKFEKNPWKPTKDIKEIKILGKLGEETGELSSAASRCIIQGIKEKKFHLEGWVEIQES